MRTFLAETARTLYRKHGDAISGLRIVFTSRRARKFFNEALLELVEGKPLWEPRYTSIDEMVREMSGLGAGDHLRLVAELYTVYAAFHPGETFDRFYSWGEVLLADFDTIDKYLIDARALYSNIAERGEIEALFADAEGQAHALSFWTVFNGGEPFAGANNSGDPSHKERFAGIWSSLYPIYHQYKERLRSLGIGYAGMIYRDVAEQIASREGSSDRGNNDGSGRPVSSGAEGSGKPAGERYVFIGFNALNACEKLMFDHLRQQGRAEFYWDYDNYFYRDPKQEAGEFIRRNIAAWGDDGTTPESDDPSDSSQGAPVFARDNFAQPKRIEVIAAPSDVMQCKALHDLLRDIHRAQGGRLGKETAVVLTDESLLTTVLHSLPGEVAEFNITMGYPLRDTLPYLFLERLLTLQSHVRHTGGTARFNHADVTGLLTHPFIVALAGKEATALSAKINKKQWLWPGAEELVAEAPPLAALFAAPEDTEAMQHYLTGCLASFAGRPGTDNVRDKEQNEFVYRIITLVEKLGHITAECGIGLSREVYARALRQMLRTQRVAYEGEPLKGLQIMGILETRNLDFEHVILLSMSDDSFPGNLDTTSYIPLSLRQAFGLPTLAEHEAMYSYYFYRLAARARSLTMLYNSASNDKSTGEHSRYIYQLHYESPHTVGRRTLGLRMSYRPAEPITADKTPEIIKELRQRRFSPTALGRYIDCPLKFYFHDVKRMRKAVVAGDDISDSEIGTALHRAMELLYEPFKGMPDAAALIAALPPQRMDACVAAAVGEVFGDRLAAECSEYRIVRRWLENMTAYDAKHGGDFRIEALEEEGEARLTLPDGSQAVIAGLADRLDRLADGTLRVIDYKSGRDRTEFPNLAALFTNEKPRIKAPEGEPRYEPRNKAALQMLMYGLIFGDRAPAVSPALYGARRMAESNEDYRSFLFCEEDGWLIDTIDDATLGELRTRLAVLIAGIFDPAIPFVQTPHTDTCRFCDFAGICHRQ